MGGNQGKSYHADRDGLQLLGGDEVMVDNQEDPYDVDPQEDKNGLGGRGSQKEDEVEETVCQEEDQVHEMDCQQEDQVEEMDYQEEDQVQEMDCQQEDQVEEMDCQEEDEVQEMDSQEEEEVEKMAGQQEDEVEKTGRQQGFEDLRQVADAQNDEYCPCTSVSESPLKALLLRQVD